MNPNALKIYTDGSALDNPGHECGCAFIVEFPDHLNKPDHEFAVSFERNTNNRAELLACIHALDYIRKHARGLGIDHAIIITDSLYICDNHRRAFTWRDSKWKNRDGRPVMNHDLWNRFLTAWQKAGVRVETQPIKGKTTDITKRVDKLAKSAAKAPIKRKDYGYHPGKVARTLSGQSTYTLFPAKGQTQLIRINSYRITSVKGEYRIGFELLASDGKTIEGKHLAFALEDIKKLIHRHRWYRAGFNDKASYPQILSIEEIPNPIP